MRLSLGERQLCAIRRGRYPVLFRFREMLSSVSYFLLAGFSLLLFICLVNRFDTVREDHLGLILATSNRIRREGSKILLEAQKRNLKISTLDSKYSLNLEKHDRLRSSQSPQVFAYFSPWCGHCQHFIPNFINRADKYQIDPNVSLSDGKILLSVDGEDPNIYFGTINCFDEKDLCQREKIEAYPTVIARYFPSGTSTLISFIINSLYLIDHV